MRYSLYACYKLWYYQIKHTMTLHSQLSTLAKIYRTFCPIYFRFYRMHIRIIVITNILLRCYCFLWLLPFILCYNCWPKYTLFGFIGPKHFICFIFSYMFFVFINSQMLHISCHIVFDPSIV